MKKNLGITLFELLLVIGILAVITAITVPVFVFFQRESDLKNSSEEVVSILRFARSKTLASEGASQYGVYFDDVASPHQYTLFKGPAYNLREVSFDEIHKLPITVEFYGINLGGGKEVVFDRLEGSTNQTGSVSLRLKDNPSKNKTIYVGGSGRIDETPAAVPVDSRQKDSRHIHFDYARIIGTATEKITLTFDGSVIQEIIIANYIEDGQIYWEGEVNVLGATQKIKIHTHRLNNPDTQFCVHRDRRYNNKSLTISISGDASGNLVEYPADGSAANSTSIYVSNFNWQ